MTGRDNKATNIGRAGSYASQIGGYKAFVPEPLPPNPPIQLDNEMLHLLSQADRELGRLDGASDKYQRNRRFVYAEYLAMFDDTVLSITDKTLPEDEEENTDLLT